MDAKWRGRSVIITPSSHQVAIQAEKEGLIGIFLASGAAWTTATAGACLGGHMGVLGEGEVCLSTTNRNFPGAAWATKAMVYLSNPAVAAASAVTGVITHPGEVLEEDAGRDRVTFPRSSGESHGSSARTRHRPDHPCEVRIYSLDEKELGKHAMEGVPGREG